MNKTAVWGLGTALIMAGVLLAVFAVVRFVAISRAPAICPAGVTAATPGGKWITGAPLLTGRSEVKAAAVSGQVVVVGGLIANNEPSVSVQVFDSISGAWREAAPLPVALHHMGVTGWDGRVYVTGGYDDGTWNADVTTSWAYDVAADTWTEIAPMPAPRAAHELVVLDGLIYALGGDAPDDPRAVWVYDPTSDTWDNRAPLPTPREHLGAVALHGRIYAIGGRWPVFGANVAIVEMYDPATDTWSTTAPMLTPRSGFASGVINGKIHVAGGEELESLCVIAQHEVYDPAADKWTTAADLPTARHGIASATIGNQWYTLAGATRTGDDTQRSFSSVVEIFTPG